MEQHERDRLTSNLVQRRKSIASSYQRNPRSPLTGTRCSTCSPSSSSTSTPAGDVAPGCARVGSWSRRPAAACVSVLLLFFRAQATVTSAEDGQTGLTAAKAHGAVQKNGRGLWLLPVRRRPIELGLGSTRGFGSSGSPHECANPHTGGLSQTNAWIALQSHYLAQLSHYRL